MGTSEILIEIVIACIKFVRPTVDSSVITGYNVEQATIIGA